VLGRIWDKHDAAWRARLAAAADYHRAHGHLAAPATTHVGAWLAEQRHLATKNTLEAARADALSALAPDWRLPHGTDWHRKYHLLRAHLATGADPATLTRDTQLAGVKIGSWLHHEEYAAKRLPRTTSPQGPARLLFAPDLVGTSGELAERLHAHAAFREIDEVAFALPFTLEHEDYVQILTDMATKLGPALGWRPAG